MTTSEALMLMLSFTYRNHVVTRQKEIDLP